MFENAFESVRSLRMVTPKKVSGEVLQVKNTTKMEKKKLNMF